jgi:hypothetical protein
MEKIIKPQLDLTKISNIILKNIGFEDYPEFCDAYIAYADYDGREMDDDELDILNENLDFIYEAVMKQIF